MIIPDVYITTASEAFTDNIYQPISFLILNVKLI